ncbi:MAG TPA: hypothetical protein VK204_16640 [Nocardioidaceae bacterium]|nr:hypothetical protein [Nocardioidaceae bacterium]
MGGEEVPADAAGPRGGTGPAGLGGLFEDLEQQAAGMHLAERDAELVDRARGEYAAVTLASRVHASTNRQVLFTLGGGEVLDGTLVEAGTDWCTISTPEPPALWLVRLAEIAVAQGMSDRAVPEAARPAVARLGFASALHRLAGESLHVVIHPVSGRDLRVRVVRIGADFVEVARDQTDAVPAASPLLVPFSAVRAVRGERL